MHFTKTIISFLAITGFAAAQLEDQHSDLVAREAAREEYLEARDEYLAARENYILAKRKAPAPTKGIMVCAIRGQGVCGYCATNAKIGSTCPCH
ncbi:unnamed protein product [Clonostachys chloroleuca]|uniref:Uncharacterized protein n=1 Tax=Clonostachys chloroleuca TaxID=1926264 RepID=A0AA35PWC5_9HYPO|nr:unnamed protein product [Clonostachys chloroleuca]